MYFIDYLCFLSESRGFKKKDLRDTIFYSLFELKFLKMRINILLRVEI